MRWNILVKISQSVARRKVREASETRNVAKPDKVKPKRIIPQYRWRVHRLESKSSTKRPKNKNTTAHEQQCSQRYASEHQGISRIGLRLTSFGAQFFELFEYTPLHDGLHILVILW